MWKDCGYCFFVINWNVRCQKITWLTSKSDIENTFHVLKHRKNSLSFCFNDIWITCSLIFLWVKRRFNVYSNYNNVQKNLWKSQAIRSFNKEKRRMKLNLQNTKSNFEILSRMINLANFKPCNILHWYKWSKVI